LLLLSMGLPLSMVIFWAARDVVELLLLHGKFDQASAEVVIRAVKAFAIGVPAMFCLRGLKGMYLVERNLREIVRVGVLTILVHVTGNLILRRYGVPGIALSGSLSLWVAAGFLWCRTPALQRRLPFPWIRFTLGSLAMALLLFAMPWHDVLPLQFLRIVIAPAGAMGVYGLAMWPSIRGLKQELRESTA